HPGWSMIMVGFLSLTASGQDATQVAKQGPTHAPMANAVAATVNGQAIMEQSLQRGLKRLPAEKQAAARTAILDYLINNALIDQYLLQLRIEVAAKDVDVRVASLKQEIRKDNQTFEKALQQLDLTENEIRSELLAEMRWEKYCNDQISEKNARQVFDKNPEFFGGSMVRAR